MTTNCLTRARTWLPMMLALCGVSCDEWIILRGGIEMVWRGGRTGSPRLHRPLH